MPLFRYAGYRKDGSRTEGIIEASTEMEAVIRLKEIGIFPSLIKVKAPSRSFRRKENLSLLTRQLSTLLEAGVPLIDSLKSMAQEASASMAEVLNDVREKVSGGSSLSKALEDHRDLFPDFYINMVKAAEMSGELPDVLKKIADYLEAQEAIKAKIRSAMIYPSIMLTVATLILLFIFLYVMPKVIVIFESSKTGLPLITRILVFITKIIKNLWFLIPLFILGLLYGARYIKKSYPEFIDRLLMREPLRILMPLYVARFTRTLSFLLEGGVSMIKALEISGKVTGNRIIEGHVIKAARSVAEGARLSSSLEIFPPVLIELIANGEKSGRLVENLKMASRAYEEEFSRRLSNIMTLLEPLLIIIMGIVVLFVVLGVVLPIFELNQLIRL